jgi:hypothetical protein
MYGIKYSVSQTFGAQMGVTSKDVSLAYGFKQGKDESPCFWCGKPTTLVDAEEFIVCKPCQHEQIEIGIALMRKKYPLAGEPERNLDFFNATHWQKAAI